MDELVEAAVPVHGSAEDVSRTWVPLLILALVSAGRVWGLGRRFARRGIARPAGFPSY